MLIKVRPASQFNFNASQSLAFKKIAARIFKMGKGFIDSTGASNLLALDLSLSKLRMLHPELFGWQGWFFKSQ